MMSHAYSDSNMIGVVYKDLIQRMPFMSSLQVTDLQTFIQDFGNMIEPRHMKALFTLSKAI